MFHVNFTWCCFIHLVGAYFSLGADLDAMRQHREEAFQLKKAVATIISATDDFIFSLPFYKYFPTQTHKNMNTAHDALYRIGNKYADQHMERIEKTVSKGEKELGQSLLEQWLIEGNMGKGEAVRNAVSLLGAGMDTVSHISGNDSSTKIKDKLIIIMNKNVLEI